MSGHMHYKYIDNERGTIIIKYFSDSGSKVHPDDNLTKGHCAALGKTSEITLSSFMLHMGMIDCDSLCGTIRI